MIFCILLTEELQRVVALEPVCELMGEGSRGLNASRAIFDNPPCARKFWPSRGVGVTPIAAIRGTFNLDNIAD